MLARAQAHAFVVRIGRSILVGLCGYVEAARYAMPWSCYRIDSGRAAVFVPDMCGSFRPFLYFDIEAQGCSRLGSVNGYTDQKGSQTPTWLWLCAKTKIGSIGSQVDRWPGRWDNANNKGLAITKCPRLIKVSTARASPEDSILY